MMMQTANRVLTFYLMLDDEDEVDEVIIKLTAGNKLRSSWYWYPSMHSIANLPTDPAD